MIVTTKILVKADMAEDTKITLDYLVKMSKAEEGVVEFRLHRDLKQENIFFLYEKYKDKEAFQEHGKTAHLKEVISWLKDHLEKEPEINFYEELEED